MTWTVLKYNVDDLKREPSNEADPEKEAHKDPLLEDRAKEIEEYVKNYTDNYLISLHYLNFPVVFMYTKKAVPLNQKYIKLEDCLEPYKEINKIINSGKYEIICGFSHLGVFQEIAVIDVILLRHKELRKEDRLANKCAAYTDECFETVNASLVYLLEILHKCHVQWMLLIWLVQRVDLLD